MVPTTIPSDPARIERAYARCRELVAARAANFSYAFLLLPRARRRGLEAIYAYCRVADDFADDEGLEPAERARNLADLRARLRRAIPPALARGPDCGDLGGHTHLDAELAPNPELDLLLEALGDTARRFGVPHADLDLVARGCEQDLTVTRYRTFQDLHDYCYLVASAVGLACLPVFGFRGDPAQARGRAVDLGLAMQLTNILRDVQEDLERDRVYLPLDELTRFGIDEAQLRAGRVDERWRSFMRFQLARAREHFARGRQLVTQVRRRSRVCPLALASIYEALLDEIERADYDVFSRRVSLSGRRKLSLLGLSMGRGVLGA